MPYLPEQIWKRRLENEYQEMQRSGEPFETNQEKNIYRIFINKKALEKGEKGEIRERYQHEAEIILKREYPYPGGVQVRWKTPIFHPNIAPDGTVCIQLLNLWSEALSIKSIVEGLKHLIENPNPRDPLNKEAGKYFEQLQETNSFKKEELKKPRIIS